MKEVDKKVIEKEYIGFKVLEVVYLENVDIHRKRQAKCICNCGTEFTVRVDQLKDRKGCRTCGQKYGGKQRILPNCEAAKKAYYATYKHNAKERNLPFELTLEQFDALTTQNCHYCGMSPQDQSYLSKSTKKHDVKYYASGIDRIYNDKGYVEGNVIPCCTKCNMMKKTLAYEEFLEHIEDIHEHMKNGYNNVFIKNYNDVYSE